MDRDQQLLSLYEISMSIGNTLELEKMLKEAVTMMLSRLNCSSVAIYQDDHLLYARPKVLLRDQGYTSVVQGLIQRASDERVQMLAEQVGDRHYYLFELKNFGSMVLVNSHGALDEQIVNAMRQIVLRLVNAIHACLDHETVVDSQARLAEAQRIARLGDWSIDLESGSLYWSDELYRIAGRTRRADMGWPILRTWIHPDTVQRHEQYLEYLGRSGSGDTLLSLTSHLLRPDGESRWLEINSEVEFDSEGVPKRFYGTAQDMTEQKLLQDEVEDNRTYLQSIFDVSPNIMITTDGREIEKVNAYMLAFFGYETIEQFKQDNDCICDNFLDVEGCLSADMEGENWLDYLLARPTQDHRACMSYDGRPHHFIVKAQQLKEGEGEKSVVMFSDVTALKSLEEELLAAKKQFDLFMCHLPHIAAIKDESDKVIYANPRAQEYLKREVIGYDALENLGPEAGTEVSRLNAQARREGRAEKVIKLTIDGQRFVTRVLVFTIPQDDEKIYLGTIYTDITKAYEDRHEIAMFKQVIEKSPLSIIITDTKGDIEYANPWAIELSGYHMDELIGQNPRVFKSDYHVAGEYIDLWKTISQGDVWSGLFKNIKKDGSVYWESAIISPVIDEEGHIENYIAIKEEITETIYLEQELAKQGEKSRELGSILEWSLNEIYIFDQKSLSFLYVNRGARENIGYLLEELLEMTPLDINPQMSVDAFKELIRPLEEDAEEEVYFTTLHQRKDRTTYPVDIYLQATSFESADAYVAMIIDTTEREQMLQEMQEQEEIMIAQSRHAAMGEMIAMIAHQWRQPITVIAMGANNMLLDVELDDLSSEEIVLHSKSILRQTDHLAKTINDFSDFFRPRKERERVRLETVMYEAEQIIGTSLRHSEITLSIEVSETCEVEIFSRELLQVYVNMLKNAQDALVAKRADDRQIDVRIFTESDDVVTTICDNGGGIDEAIITKVFDPYFSTKIEKNGTGLGLYMSKTIIEKHLFGTIEASNVNEGTCMTVRIPIDVNSEIE